MAGVTIGEPDRFFDWLAQSPDDNWIRSSKVEFKRNQIIALNFKTGRWVTLRTRDVGFIGAYNGAYLD